MKKRRLFENAIEFLLLCVVLFLYFWLIIASMSGEYSDSGGRDTALGFGISMLLFYVAVYVLTFFVNLVPQSIFLTNSSKTAKHYYCTKIMLFVGTILVVPTLLRIAFEQVLVINLALYISVFISSLIIFLFFFLPHTIIIALFYFFDKKHKIKRNQSLHHVESIESKIE